MSNNFFGREERRYWRASDLVLLKKAGGDWDGYKFPNWNIANEALRGPVFCPNCGEERIYPSKGTPIRCKSVFDAFCGFECELRFAEKTNNEKSGITCRTQSRCDQCYAWYSKFEALEYWLHYEDTQLDERGMYCRRSVGGLYRDEDHWVHRFCSVVCYEKFLRYRDVLSSEHPYHPRRVNDCCAACGTSKIVFQVGRMGSRMNVCSSDCAAIWKQMESAIGDWQSHKWATWNRDDYIRIAVLSHIQQRSERIRKAKQRRQRNGKSKHGRQTNDRKRHASRALTDREAVTAG